MAADTMPGTRTPAVPVMADRVRAQLSGDYPPSALSWVSSVSWDGPVQVPATQIDFASGQADWDAAAAAKAKLQVFRKRLQARGWWKPAVVLRLPGSPRLLVVDGHTRITAAKALGIPVLAYVGTARTATGPWSGLHSQQLAGDASGAIELVGPKGYVHNWHFVGPQAVGAKVFHPGLGHGTVTGHDGGSVRVRFNAGGERSFKASPGAGRGRLEKHEGAVRPSPDQVRGMPPAGKKRAGPGRAHRESAKPQSASDRLAAARKSGAARKAGTGFKGQQGETHVETYKDGSKWVSKNLPTKSDADREELAGKISDILGAGAPSIVREGDTQVHEPFVEGKVAASLYRDGMSDAQIDAAGDKLKSLLSTPEGKRIGLLDKLIGNQDRHLGNWMISPDGKPIPIDHNWSWEGTKQTISPFSDAVYGPGIELSDFPKDQMDEWQSKLAALKPGLNASQQKLLARTMKSLARFRSGKD